MELLSLDRISQIDNCLIRYKLDFQPTAIQGKGRFYALGMFKPAVHPKTWMDQAIDQCAERSWPGLHKVWEDLQFRVRDGTHVEAPFRMNFLALRTFWLKHALVGFKKGHWRCTCLMSAQHGHCIHEYIVKEVHAKLGHKPQQYGWPPAKMGQVVLQGARSNSSSSS